jgi:hypothetical protein
VAALFGASLPAPLQELRLYGVQRDVVPGVLERGQLVKLELSAFDPSADDLRSIATALHAAVAAGEPHRLREFLTWGCQMGDRGMIAELAPALSEHTALEKLSLVANGLGDAGARAAADVIRLQSRLERLHILINAIGSAGARAIGNALRGSGSETSQTTSSTTTVPRRSPQPSAHTTVCRFFASHPIASATAACVRWRMRSVGTHSSRSSIVLVQQLRDWRGVEGDQRSDRRAPQP